MTGSAGRALALCVWVRDVEGRWAGVIISVYVHYKIVVFVPEIPRTCYIVCKYKCTRRRVLWKPLPYTLLTLLMFKRKRYSVADHCYNIARGHDHYIKKKTKNMNDDPPHTPALLPLYPLYLWFFIQHHPCTMILVALFVTHQKTVID